MIAFDNKFRKGAFWLLSGCVLAGAAFLAAGGARVSRSQKSENVVASVDDQARDTGPASLDSGKEVSAGLAVNESAPLTLSEQRLTAKSEFVSGGRALRKAEFIGVMQARAEFVEKVRLSMAKIKAARATAGPDAQGHHTATGRAYREAVLAVEAALDDHPRLQALQAQYDALQEQKREHSNEMAGILDGWRLAHSSAARDYDAAVARLSQDAWREQQALLTAEDARSPGRLSAAGQQRYQDVQSALTNALAEVTATFQQATSETGLQARREADGASERFEALTGELKEINAQQDGLKQEMHAARDALRTQAPGIAALQEQARTASHRHLKATQARPDVAEALAWVQGAGARQRDLDEQAYALYASISSEYPDLRDELDGLARQGGLVLTGEALRVAGERAGMTSEREK